MTWNVRRVTWALVSSWRCSGWSEIVFDAMPLWKRQAAKKKAGLF